MKTYASLFTGFGGADLGAVAAGMQPVWGVEYDAAIAEVGNANLGQHIKVADILGCKPRDFERVDVLHASPPCPSFSVAKAGGVETAHDLAMASKVAEFVTALQPQVFTLENVQAYRKSRSWHIINEALNSAGYWLNIEIVNSADMGVPQTRKRMIVRAIRGGFVPYLPQPVPWVGWYAAIEDMLDTLPESQFADWQLARLPKELLYAIDKEGSGQISRESKKIDSAGGLCGMQCSKCAGCSSYRWQSSKQQCVEPDEGMPQVSYEKARYAPEMYDMRRTSEGDGLLQQALSSLSEIRRSTIYETEASNTQKNPNHYFCCAGCAEKETDMGCFIRSDFPQSENQETRRNIAFLINGDNASRDCSVRTITEPTFTVTDGRKHPLKAFLMDSKNVNQEYGKRYRTGDEPAPTVTTDGKPSHAPRAFDGGRVVAMTPRALARFQSFPDRYMLPDSKTLAAKGIGNAVPPLLMQRVLEGLLP